MHHVIIPTKNKQQFLNLTLQSLMTQDSGTPEFTVHVACDDLVTKRPFGIWKTDWSLIANYERKPGRSGARNAGLAWVRENYAFGLGDRIIFLDDDRIVNDRFILEHSTTERIGIAGAVNLRVHSIADPKVNERVAAMAALWRAGWKYREENILWNHDLRNSELQRKALIVDNEPEFPEIAQKLSMSTHTWRICNGGNFSIPADLATEEFDEKFIGWGMEDHEYALRINRKIPIQYNNAAATLHQFHLPSEGALMDLQRNKSYFWAKYPELFEEDMERDFFSMRLKDWWNDWFRIVIG